MTRSTFSIDIFKLAAAVIAILALVGVIHATLTLAFVCIFLLTFTFTLTWGR